MAYSGKYKGTTFRSLLELSAMMYFEAEGYEFEYETVKIPYGKTRTRTYIVDLAFRDHKMLVEVKPERRADNKRNLSKRKAAEEWCQQNGWQYVILTDEILRDCAQVITLEQAGQMQDVVLNERAKRALRRKEARKKRKSR